MNKPRSWIGWPDDHITWSRSWIPYDPRRAVNKTEDDLNKIVDQIFEKNQGLFILINRLWLNGPQSKEDLKNRMLKDGNFATLLIMIVTMKDSVNKAILNRI